MPMLNDTITLNGEQYIAKAPHRSSRFSGTYTCLGCAFCGHKCPKEVECTPDTEDGKESSNDRYVIWVKQEG